MRDWPYFTNEATNLDAAALLLAAIGDPASVSRDPRALNKVWDNVAQRLVDGDDITFQRWLDAVDALLIDTTAAVSNRVGDVVVAVTVMRRCRPND